MRSKLPIIDEIDYLPIVKEESKLFFPLVDKRQDPKRSIRSFSETYSKKIYTINNNLFNEEYALLTPKTKENYDKKNREFNQVKEQNKLPIPKRVSKSA